MARQISRKHHYVPKFLLEPWVVNDVLNAYYWDEWTGKIKCKKRGARFFCNEVDLLTLKDKQLESDALERTFFGDIDTKGAAARDYLIRNDPFVLSDEQKIHFSGLLLSLEYRYPPMVQKLRDWGPELAKILDSDKELIDEMRALGISGSPSNLVASPDTWFENRSLSVIQRLVSSPKVIGDLLDLHWQLKRLGPQDGTFVLSDRPLIRFFGLDDERVSWFLPLSPTIVFIATNLPQTFEWITCNNFRKLLNVNSVNQVQKYAFTVDTSHTKLLEKRLPNRDAS